MTNRTINAATTPAPAQGALTQARAKHEHHSAIPGLVASAAMFIVCMDTFITNVALPTIEAELGGGMAAQQWVVDGYTLPFATLLLLAGNLSDRFGAKRAFSVGTAVFGIASLVCGFAGSIGMLVFGRALLGVGAALILPSSMSLIREGYPDGPSRAKALAFWGIGGSAATAVGPILGGLLVQIHWSLTFFINVPVCLVILVLCVRLAASPTVSVPFDLVGQALAIVGLGCLVGGIIESGSEGIAGFPGVLLAVGVAAIVGFLYSQARVAHPMMPLGLFATRDMRMPMLGGFTMIFNWNGLVFIATLALQQQLGLSPFAAGMAFVPAAVTGILGNLLSDRLVGGKGYRFAILVAVSCMIVGFGTLIASSQSLAIWHVTVGTIAVGFGGAIGTPALSALVLRSAPTGQGGIASAVFNTMRQVGGAVGVAIFGVYATALPSFADGLTAAFATSLVLVAAMFAYAFRARGLGQAKAQ